jgi:hypothetical protein
MSAPILDSLTILKGSPVNMRQDMGQKVFVVEVRPLILFYVVPDRIRCIRSENFLFSIAISCQLIESMI